MSNYNNNNNTPVNVSPGVLSNDREPSDEVKQKVEEQVSRQFDDGLEEDGDVISLDNSKDSSDSSDEEDVVKKASYKLTNLKVHSDERFPCYDILKNADDIPTVVAISNHTAREINNSPRLVEHINMDPKEAAKKGKKVRSEEWLDALESTIPLVPMDGMFDNSLDREGSEWHQYLESEGKRIRPYKPRYERPEEGRVQGETAQALLDTRLGIGGHLTIPLPHSGFWITLKPVEPLEFIALDEKLAAVKNSFGRDTLGLIFNNNRVYVVKHLVEFLLDRVYDCTLEGWQDLDLAKHIKLTDLLILAAGGGYTQYPHGFDYVSPCTADNSCEHVTRAVLKIPNCIWYDHPAFSKMQREMLANRNTQYSLEKVQKYQDEFDNNNNVYVTENEDITIYFKIPTIREHIEAGEAWLTEIETMVDEAVAGEELNYNEKQARMRARITQTSLRQQAHFFKRLTFSDGVYLEGSEDMYKSLNSLSNRPELSEGIMEHVSKYIDDNIHAIVAIPRYNCEKCGEKESKDIDKHPFLVPLDTINLFFTLGNQRLHFGSPNMLSRKQK